MDAREDQSTAERSLLPPPVSAGSKVAIVAPAGLVKDRALLETSLEVLRSWGLQPVVFEEPVAVPTDGAQTATSFLSGKFNCSIPDQPRADLLMAAFTDDDIAAVLCARGGYGAMRLLQRIDWGRLAAQLPKKRLFGFSDITALHNACTAELRARHADRPWLVCFSSPMPATPLWAAAAEANDLERLRCALFAPSLSSVFAGMAGRPLYGGSSSGEVVGRLVGGNLSLLASTTGTPWAMLAGVDLRTTPFVLAIEDTGEAPYRIDRMLQQLRLVGLLDAAAAVLLGDFEAPEGPDGQRFAAFKDNPLGVAAEDFFWREVVQLPSGVPVLVGCPFGHGRRNVTLPFGAKVAVEGGRVIVLAEDPEEAGAPDEADHRPRVWD